MLVIFGRIFVFALMFEYCIQIRSCKFVSTRGFGSLQYDTWDNKTLKPAHTDHISKSLSFWNFVFVFLFLIVFVFAEVHHGRRGGAYCRKAPATWLLLTTGYFHSGAIVHRPTPSSETTTLLFLNSQGQFRNTKHYLYIDTTFNIALKKVLDTVEKDRFFFISALLLC